MATLTNLSPEETGILQMQCAAYRSGDFQVMVGNVAVRDFLLWDYDHGEEEDNPFDVESVEEWVVAQQELISTRDSMLRMLPSDPNSDWRFHDWAETLSTLWATNLVEAIADAQQWILDYAQTQVDAWRKERSESAGTHSSSN